MGRRFKEGRLARYKYAYSLNDGGGKYARMLVSVEVLQPSLMGKAGAYLH
jgi:hypothetical protein